MDEPTPDEPTCDCDDVAGTPQASRRGLLRGAALAGATTMFGSAVVTLGGALPAAAAPRRGLPAIVVLSLRGAADGLSLVVPHGDPAYYEGRPTIAIPSTSLLAKDGFFGLHPSLAPLLPMWDAGRLAAVHATGLPVPNRSHFAAMEAVEDADPGSAARVGWLNRLIGASPTTGPVQGLAVGGGLPAAFLGPEAVMAFESLDDTMLPGGDAWHDPHQTRLRSLDRQWRDTSTEMGSGVRTAMGALAGLGRARTQKNHWALYPQTDLGDALSAVARTLRADIGVSAVTVDSGIWDMHTDLGTVDAGWMARLARDLAASVAGFFKDLGPVADRVTLVTISEFGRRVQENGSRGLDHGWGNAMLVAGAGVRGGRYYGTWPGLENTFDADLAVTTDYRSVLAEIVAARTSASTAAVFPGFRRERVGVMLGQ